MTPRPLPVKPENIPEPLKGYTHHVCWSYEERKGKNGKPYVTKIPKNPRTGGNAMANNPATWGPFNVALAYYRAHSDNGIAGVGFELGDKATPFVAWDFDHCRDPETGETDPEVSRIVGILNSYTEITPSKTGLRVITIGVLPPDGRKKGHFECYDSSHFLTLTGWHLENTPRTVEARHDEIIEVHRKIFGDGTEPKTKERPASSVNLDDEALLNKARGAANGAAFSRLYEGLWEGDYPSQSEADMALSLHLAFWTSKDAARMDALFRQSGLLRAKWDEKHHADGSTYGQETIRRAIERTTDTYSASRPTNGGQPNAEKTRQDKQPPEDEAVPGSLSSDEIMDALDANEDGDAIFFIRLHQGRFAYDHSGGCWHVFRDHHWHEDTTDQTVAALQNVIELYGVEAEKQAKCRLEAEKAGQKEQAGQHETLEEALLKRIRQLQGLKRKMDVLRLAAIDWSAQGRPSLALTGEEWDRHPMLLGCSNGVIDLTSGEHRPGRPTDYIKTFAPTPWLGLDAPAPLWAKFLAEIFAGDQEIISYIQRLLGYGITGRTTELIFPIFHGPHGRNGKGTLLETLRHVLGDFAAPIEAEMLLLQNHPRQSGAPASDIMALRGKRLVWASETGDGRRLDVGKVKWVTGGDTMTGRAPYGRRQVNFPPTHKVILLTNHKPHAPANDDALWVRLHLIPFNVSFVDNPTKPNERPRNPSLPEDLKGEASGILGWLVQGSLLWQKEGLRPPKTVLTATESYRKDEDLVGNFLSECCIEDENAEAPAGKLYTAYQKWCTEMGHKPMSGTKFGIDMKERFDSYGDRRGIFYMGLGLRERDFTEEGD